MLLKSNIHVDDIVPLEFKGLGLLEIDVWKVP